MKRFVFGVLAAAALFSAGRVSAQEKGVSFSGGADIVSTYLWRGVYEAGRELPAHAGHDRRQLLRYGVGVGRFRLDHL